MVSTVKIYLRRSFNELSTAKLLFTVSNNPEKKHEFQIEEEMTFLWTPRFEKAYRTLPTEQQTAVDAHLRLMAQNWRHPSLQTKRLPGTRNIWYLRVSRDLRLTFEPARTGILLRNVGHIE